MVSDYYDRTRDNPFARYLGYLVSTPVDFNLALEVMNALYWSKVPKPNILQKTVADLTREILKANAPDFNFKLRIEIYKLLNLGYITKHQYKRRYKYTVSISDKGINFLDYETADDKKKLELKNEWGIWYVNNELTITDFINKELLKL